MIHIIDILVGATFLAVVAFVIWALAQFFGERVLLVLTITPFALLALWAVGGVLRLVLMR